MMTGGDPGHGRRYAAAGVIALAFLLGGAGAYVLGRSGSAPIPGAERQGALGPAHLDRARSSPLDRKGPGGYGVHMGCQERCEFDLMRRWLVCAAVTHNAPDRCGKNASCRARAGLALALRSKQPCSGIDSPLSRSLCAAILAGDEGLCPTKPAAPATYCRAAAAAEIGRCDALEGSTRRRCLHMFHASQAMRTGDPGRCDPLLKIKRSAVEIHWRACQAMATMNPARCPVDVAALCQ